MPTHSASGNGVEATLNLAGVASPTVHYGGSSVQAGQLYRFALQADASTLPTGIQPWEMTVVERYSDGSSSVRTYHGQQVINNRRDSEYGNRWSLLGVDRLVTDEFSAVLVGAGGNAVSFWKTGQPGWRGEPGNGFLTLTGDESTGYTLTDNQGNVSEFDTDGLLTARRDRLGNQTTFSYSSGQLAEIVDPTGRTTSFSYAGGRLQSVTDFAGRVTTFQHDGQGRLVSITQPDPDGPGPLGAPATSFGYDPATHLMTSLTNAEGKTSSFAYDAAGTLSTITHPDQQQQHVRSIHVRGMVDAAAGSGTLASPAPLVRTAQIQGEVRDALGLPTTFTTDRFGLTTSSTDALGNVTTYDRNSHGLVTRSVGPDPDRPGPLPAPQTLCQYDSLGNLTAVAHLCPIPMAPGRKARRFAAPASTPLANLSAKSIRWAVTGRTASNPVR